MHTQQRRNQQPAPSTKQTPVATKPAAVRSAPAVLDERALRQVSGAGSGPAKGW
jgi:hypothetical protein